ncbi:hypothetical protein CC2G_008307 [Coprinopsis cinerea AmutBmut pab1-1]|nr:hypothetical protein CC2G_008307 [Coprinopsis cinerea AmutBmut pab1-1]
MKSAFAVVAAIAALAVATPIEKRQIYGPGFPPVTELRYCINPFNIAACLTAHSHAEVASLTAYDYFPNSLWNGQGDAFRHCYWNARMAIDLGVARAKTIADNHEAAVENNPPDQEAMDLANNKTGRVIGVSAPGNTKQEKYSYGEQECRRRALAGELVTLY